MMALDTSALADPSDETTDETSALHFEASPPLLQSEMAFFTARPAPAIEATASAMSVAQVVAVAAEGPAASEAATPQMISRILPRIVQFERMERRKLSRGALSGLALLKDSGS